MKFTQSNALMYVAGVALAVAGAATILRSGKPLNHEASVPPVQQKADQQVIGELELASVRLLDLAASDRKGLTESVVAGAADTALKARAAGRPGWSALLLTCAEVTRGLPCDARAEGWLTMVAEGGESAGEQVRAWARLGWRRNQSGDVAGAIKAFEGGWQMFQGAGALKPVEFAAQYVSIGNGLANRLADAGDLGRALQVHTEALGVAEAALSPVEVRDMRRNQARLLSAASDPLAAAEQLRLVVGTAPSSEEQWPEWLLANCRLGQALGQAGHHAEAAQVLRNAWSQEQGRRFVESALLGQVLCEELQSASFAGEWLSTCSEVCDVILARRAEWAGTVRAGAKPAFNPDDVLMTMASTMQGAGESFNRPEYTVKGVNILKSLATDPATLQNLKAQPGNIAP